MNRSGYLPVSLHMPSETGKLPERYIPAKKCVEELSFLVSSYLNSSGAVCLSTNLVNGAECELHHAILPAASPYVAHRHRHACCPALTFTMVFFYQACKTGLFCS